MSMIDTLGADRDLEGELAELWVCCMNTAAGIRPVAKAGLPFVEA